MQKIKSLFKRNYEGNRLVYDAVVEGCEWVQNEDGVIATRKFDGTPCMIKGNTIYKRYDVKKGRVIPTNAIPCEPERNEETGHWPHWVEIDFENRENLYFLEGWKNTHDVMKYYWGMTSPFLKDGTYELCGPKINGNNEAFVSHILIPHGKDILSYYKDYIPTTNFPADFESTKEYLLSTNIEGIVWYGKGGKMAKIKKKDFGFKRNEFSVEKRSGI